MSVDSRDFRKALGSFATGVTVVTTTDGDGKAVGVTINAFTSVSLDPPLVAFCLGRNSTLFGIFDDCDGFVVNILSARQEGISNHFASRRHQDDWTDVATTATESGIPALVGTTATIECRRENALDGGDHVIYVGRVMNVTMADDADPLLYFRGRYAGLAQTP